MNTKNVCFTLVCLVIAIASCAAHSTGKVTLPAAKLAATTAKPTTKKPILPVFSFSAAKAKVEAPKPTTPGKPASATTVTAVVGKSAYMGRSGGSGAKSASVVASDLELSNAAEPHNEFAVAAVKLNDTEEVNIDDMEKEADKEMEDQKSGKLFNNPGSFMDIIMKFFSGIFSSFAGN